jgi:hypothetical protein
MAELYLERRIATGPLTATSPASKPGELRQQSNIELGPGPSRWHWR